VTPLGSDPAYQDLTDEERDAIADRILDHTPAGEHDARDFVGRFPAEEQRAQEALRPRSGNVEKMRRTQ